MRRNAVLIAVVLVATGVNLWVSVKGQPPGDETPAGPKW